MKIKRESVNFSLDALLERVREAHAEVGEESAKIGSTDSPPLGPTSAAREVDATGPASTIDQPSAPTPMQGELLDIAKDILNGKYERSAQVRERVIECIFEHQYAASLPPERRDEAQATLKAALVDDPQFSRDVEEMLVHAARQCTE